MSNDFIFKLSGYDVSRDYERLADEMQRQSVICIVDYGDCRDVAHTVWRRSKDGNGVWQLSARGIAYIYAFSRADFVGQCIQNNVDVLMPNKPAADRAVRHGIDCLKAPHDRVMAGYLHADTDDGPYDVDGCLYCGRCHCAL